MTVGLLLITHENYGDVSLQTVKTILGVCPLETRSMGVPFDANPDEIYADAKRYVKMLDHGEGVLILTDLYGSTPSNIAQRLVEDGRAAVVTGLNLSMLVRVLNYPNLSLRQLTDKASRGGGEGVVVSLKQEK
ncbi:MAG: PTS fructose transporter subunit IIA [Gammaproteobacteria bacterium]|jgi:PTS system ascorbate-specific IIA component